MHNWADRHQNIFQKLIYDIESIIYVKLWTELVEERSFSINKNKSIAKKHEINQIKKNYYKKSNLWKSSLHWIIKILWIVIKNYLPWFGIFQWNSCCGGIWLSFFVNCFFIEIVVTYAFTTNWVFLIHCWNIWWICKSVFFVMLSMAWYSIFLL